MIAVRHKILTSAALAAIAILVLSTNPLKAESTSSSNFTHCWQRSNQNHQGNYQLMAQASPMGFPGCCGGGGWGHGSHYGRIYDPKSIETISGEVVDIDTFTPIGGMSQGMHLRLKTDSETVDVHLGPAWYLENQDFTIVPKDKIEVTGSKISFSGQPALIATQIKKGNAILILRDENGFPRWSGWRQR
jgi:hypothetical protein